MTFSRKLEKETWLIYSPDKLGINSN